MPVIRRFHSFVIRMYFHDENPPHVHVVGRYFEARVAIEGAAILSGKLPSRVRKLALPWIEANKALLLAEWEDKQG